MTAPTEVWGDPVDVVDPCQMLAPTRSAAGLAVTNASLVLRHRRPRGLWMRPALAAMHPVLGAMVSGNNGVKT